MLPSRALLDSETKRELRRRRAIYFGVWGAFALGALFLFRAVLLPFFLALIVAYVMMPAVRWLEGRELRGRPIPRWAAVLVLYLILLGSMVGFTIVSVPRLAVEVQNLAKEIPRTVATARQEWLPEVERRLRRSMDAYAEEHAGESQLGGATPAPERPDAGETAASIDSTPGADAERGIDALAHPGAEPKPTALFRVIPSGDGFSVEVPAEGIHVETEGDRIRIRPALPDEANVDADFGVVITDALDHLSSGTSEQASELIGAAQRTIRSVIRGVFTFFVMLMLSAYLLVTSESIVRFFRSMWPREHRPSYDQLLARIDQGLAGVVRGQLIIALVNGGLSGVGFYFLDLRYWPVLTLFVTVLSIIPFFGSIISTVPVLMIALQQSFMTSLLAFLWIVIIHQIEGNLLNPKIMGDSAHVHPVLVVFALLAGESLFGIAGALLAVPVLSITQSLFLHYREIIVEEPARAVGERPSLPDGFVAVRVTPAVGSEGDVKIESFPLRPVKGEASERDSSDTQDDAPQDDAPQDDADEAQGGKDESTGDPQDEGAPKP